MITITGMTITRILAGMTAGTLIVASTTATTAAHRMPVTQVVHLRPVGTSRVSGTAVVTYNTKTRQTIVTLTARHLAAGVHLAHIRSGRCGGRGALRYVLTALHGPGTWTTFTTFRSRLSLAGLSIDVYGQGTRQTMLVAVACGNVT